MNKILAMQKWMRERKIPYIHGCVWDRTCREFAKRITLHIPHRDISVYWELPGYYAGLDKDEDGELVWRKKWHRTYFWTSTRKDRT